MRHTFCIATIVATTSFASATARAQTTTDVATVGVSLSVKVCCSKGGAVGFGPAFNYAHWLSKGTTSTGATVGGYGWLQYYPSLNSARLGLGPQASYLFGGLEAGPSLLFGREPTDLTASLTPFGSIGFTWIGLRINFVDPAKTDALLEFVAGLGYPIGFDRLKVVQNATGSGRPIRIDGIPYGARTRVDRDFAPVLAVTLPRSARARRARARRWREDGELEYASVAAFEYLERDLQSLGAPDELLTRCAQAARDERKHTRMCYALASAYGGRALGPAPLDLPARYAAPVLATIVRETVVDGCLGEGIAAATARARLHSESDVVVRRVLRAIARDEARHAGLAWKIVEWACDASALDAALRDVEQQRFADAQARVVQRRVARRLRRLIDRMTQTVTAVRLSYAS